MNEFRVLGVICIIFYRKNMRHYITYNVTFELQKTREWSLTPLSKYTFENPGCGQRGGQMNPHKYQFICSEFLDTFYLRIY